MHSAACLLLATTLVSAAPTPDEMAERLDTLIAEGLADEGVRPAEQCSDEEFLRRATLDLTSEIPKPGDVTRFGLDSSSNKRGAAIDRLVESSASDTRWSRYWADAIYLRATNARAQVSRPSFESWMAGQLRENRGWDEIVADIVTATGEVRENGATALIFAHDGDANEIAAETARLFTGIQMSCANCHDHPSDQWKRTQFHELAAYFPRVRVRTDRSDGRPKFYVFAQDVSRGNPAERLQGLMRLDRNRDGKLTEREASNFPQAKQAFERVLDVADTNGDGMLTAKELKEAPAPQQQRNTEIEHYMADLDNPSSKGERMQPVFFATNDRLPVGARDAVRRNSLASSLTSSQNEWFSKALVNRYWHELMGEAFYMPVDDLGPTREAMLPEVLDTLAGGFRRSGLDLRWLLKTITRTEAYQRKLAEPEYTDYTAGTTSVTATRLDADQLYGALRGALNVTQLGTRGSRNVGQYSIPSTDRAGFNEVFGEDPSTPKVDVVSSIPQALALMNSPFIEQNIAGQGRTRLADMLRKFRDNEDVAIELYLAVLGREPNDDEIDTVLEFVSEASSRTDGFEDVYWALINSAEFLNRR